MKTPKQFDSLNAGADFIFKELGSDIRLAAPLGLGKPNQLLNEIYRRVKNDNSKKLKIFTALSLAPPEVTEDLGRRFFEPFAERHWGKDYPNFEYFKDAAKDRAPYNIQVHEFYFQAGNALRSNHLQRHYQSVNYTHVAENILRGDANIIVQYVAIKKEDDQIKYSLSCNPDLTLDVVDLFKQAGKKIMVVAVVHKDLPFLQGDACVEDSFFDAVIDSTEVTHQLFALPRMPISIEDHLIGFYASQLVVDGGTIQIGIGSLSDSVVSALYVRQTDNARYIDLKNTLTPVRDGHSSLFNEGLYGLTEMLTDGFMHLRRSGILKRTVMDESNQEKTFVHGSFILGSKPFYEWLRNLSDSDARGLRMTRVSKVNDLFDPNEMLLRRQRIRPRFFNTTMQVSLLGEAMSETLPNASVVSGVGGQYNFVAMSRELKDSRSVLMLRSTRIDNNGKTVSNIVWQPGHVTIPRHLRDIVVTEYGVADLRGRSDSECIEAMLSVCDSRFQDSLLIEAKKQNKVDLNFTIPEAWRNNTPSSIKIILQNKNAKVTFAPFPFGSDFTKEEEHLALALEKIQKDGKQSVFRLIKAILQTSVDKNNFTAELMRMKLENPKSLKEHFYQRLLLGYLT